MKTVLLLILLCSNVAAAGKDHKEIATNMYQKIKSDFKDVSELKLSRVQGLMDKNKIVFVDVRGKKERDISVIPGAISIKEFEANIQHYQNKIVAVYCTIGYRSAKYVRKLKKKNVSAFNLEGSILGWVHGKRRVANPQGKPVKTVHVFGSNWNHLPAGYKGVW